MNVKRTVRGIVAFKLALLTVYCLGNALQQSDPVWAGGFIVLVWATYRVARRLHHVE